MSVAIQWTTEGDAVLSSPEIRFRYWSKRIACLETLVPEKTKNVSVKIIRTALGNNVHDAAGRAPKLRRKGIRDDLKFLNGFLRNSRPRSVDRIVSIVSAINLDEI